MLLRCIWYQVHAEARGTHRSISLDVWQGDNIMYTVCMHSRPLCGTASRSTWRRQRQTSSYLSTPCTARPTRAVIAPWRCAAFQAVQHAAVQPSSRCCLPSACRSVTEVLPDKRERLQQASSVDALPLLLSLLQRHGLALTKAQHLHRVRPQQQETIMMQRTQVTGCNAV